MLRRRDHEGGWPRRLARACGGAAVLLLLLAPWLSHDRPGQPGEDRTPGPATARSILTDPLSPRGIFVTPAGRAAFAFEPLLAQRMTSMAEHAGRGLRPQGGMSAEDFRRLYEGDGADYADLVLGPR